MRTLPMTVPISEPVLRVLDAASAVDEAASGTIATLVAALDELRAALDAARIDS